MRLTVLGGCGAWPTAGLACSGYLVEHDGFRVLIDPGYAVLPRLLQVIGATEVDAVLVSHGHPDHCADLNPLLRARVLGTRVLGAPALGDDALGDEQDRHGRQDPPPRLPVYAPQAALGPVLALDRPGMLDDALDLHEFRPGEEFAVGPFGVRSWLLPHWLPNAGLRLDADGSSLAYTGDTGPSPELLDLAANADIYLAEATYPWAVPADSARYLSSARQAGQTAARAGAGRLMLTHLWPGTDPTTAVEAAAASYDGPVSVATPDAR
jgi:ribonuclease BN (tRNA processing enzyme)